jgi:serine/threonine protein kinase
VKKSDFQTVENELKIMQHIRHPNTLLFIGVSDAEDKFYIVTELAQLGNMEDLLKGKSCIYFVVNSLFFAVFSVSHHCFVFSYHFSSL